MYWSCSKLQLKEAATGNILRRDVLKISQNLQ